MQARRGRPATPRVLDPFSPRARRQGPKLRVQGLGSLARKLLAIECVCECVCVCLIVPERHRQTMCLTVVEGLVNCG